MARQNQRATKCHNIEERRGVLDFCVARTRLVNAMKMKAAEGEGITRIHNVRFYNLPPRSINCLSYNQRSGKLALSR